MNMWDNVHIKLKFNHISNANASIHIIHWHELSSTLLFISIIDIDSMTLIEGVYDVIQYLNVLSALQYMCVTLIILDINGRPFSVSNWHFIAPTVCLYV